MRTRTILLASLMIMMSMTPLVSADYDKGIEQGKEYEDSSVFDLPAKTIDAFGPRIDTGASGRAPCSAVQTDAGSAGDAGNTSATAKSLGTDPTNGPSGVTGCVDANDPEDMYSITTTSGKEVDVELVVPANADFDLYLVDATKSTFYDYSEYNDPLEQVTTGGTALEGNATTFYVWVNAYSGDGTYTLRVWTNNSVPKPDITITMVDVPVKAQAGDTVSVNYTVENLANNSSATTGAFDVFFILSTDTTYDAADELLDDVSKEADLGAGASRNTTMSVTLPANLTNDSYYWLVWADGYGNITESDSSNNNMWSTGITIVGNDCADLMGGTQNDGGLGADAAGDTANATNMGSNITATYTGCMDGVDGDDIFAFDVPAGYFLEIELDAEDQTSDLDIFIHYSNGSEVDRGYTSSYPETATAKLTDYEGVGGTYYVNVTHYSGVSNYTLDVWTNQSIPAPDYVIDSVTSAGSGQPGDMFDVTAVLENQGTVDGVSSVELVAILSVNTGVEWYDHEIGSITTSGIPIDTNTSVTISSTIPADIVEGDYYLYVVVDQDELILERDETNNQGSRTGQFSIGNAETSCVTQNDAGMGGDAANNTAGAYDLGNYADAEYRGCIDSGDTSDHYTITLSAGQNLNVTLVDPPAGAVNLVMVDSSGNVVDSDSSWFSDAEVSTFGTSSEGLAGTYTLMINRSTSWLESGGAGTYRLLIGSPAGYVAPFTCSGYSDAGTGTDAGTDMSNAIVLGTNPALMGQGCLDGQDTSDAYQFDLEDYNNINVMFSPDTGSPFTASLYDEESNMVAGWNGTEWMSMGDSEYEGQNGMFILVIDSAGGEGYYNLSINSMPPAPADLAVSNLSCGGEMVSNDELFYSFEIHNLRGPAVGDFNWSIHLTDENGVIVEEIDSSATSTYSTYGQLVLERASSTFIDATTASGTYSCHVMINMDRAVDEMEIINNELMGENFTIQNEEELWANDADRDGYNTTDTGDGIVDDCPDKYGESWGDRYGCADLDGDGWSNLNDFSPLDESQWVDEDEDGFGDNSTGYLGDQCPGVYGVENGEGGDGCPPPFVDSDEDGVQNSDDDCDATPAGATVDENGCEVDTDGDGVVDSMDDCPATGVGVTVDSMGCEVTDNNGGGSGDNGGGTGDGGSDNNGNSADDGESTDDSAEGGTDAVMIGGIGFGVVVIILLTFLIIRKGRGNNDLAEDAFANAAFNQPMAGMAAADPSITPEQLQYEQQLLAHGYTAEQARAYADQHFRPWLNQ
ncbi:MAG: hypothetical protein CMA39_05615 [Euryarchaeota archaeon]|nr:hypothetical protein [Euryarchaeota archaeon]|tara:strand:+ start:21826 stop:25599 length:3774 start_codon:yes stop_codon:yes gene_type:complete